MAEIAPIVQLSAFGRGVIFHCRALPELSLELVFNVKSESLDSGDKQ